MLWFFLYCLMFLVTCLLPTQSSDLENLMVETDLYFSNLRANEEVVNFQTTIFKPYMVQNREKRELSVPQGKDVYVVTDLEKITGRPIKFLIDFLVVDLNDKLFAYSLQSESEENAGSSIVIYQIEEENYMWNPVEVFNVDGATQMELLDASDLKLLVVAEKEKCTIYEVTPQKHLSLIQTLRTSGQSRLNLLNMNGKRYLAIANALQTNIYDWEGLHFDLIQRLPAREVHSMDFFAIDNTIYLATVGKSGSNRLWRQNLNSGLFEYYQKLENKMAAQVHYFETHPLNEQFLAVVYRDNLAMIYKYDGEHFIRFQDFNIERPVQWMDLKGRNGDFFLFLSSWDEVSGLSYDGWKFQLVEMPGSRSFGTGNKFMRGLYHRGSPLLAVATPGRLNSSTIITKPKYSMRQSSADHLSSMYSWCSSHEMLHSDALKEVLSKVGISPNISEVYTFVGPRTLRKSNLKKLIVKGKFGKLNPERIERVNEVSKKINDVNELLQATAPILKDIATKGVTVAGPTSLKFLELQCSGDLLCNFPTMSVKTLNQEAVDQFFETSLRISKGINLSELEFNDLQANNLSAAIINAHQASTLVSREYDSSIDSDMIVNGTAVFHAGVVVGGEVDGIFLDREHTLLIDEDQTLAGSIIIGTGFVENVTLKQSLNDANIHNIDVRIDLPVKDNWDQLSVLNLQLPGVLMSKNTSAAVSRSLFTPTKGAWSEETLIANKITVKDNKVSGVNLDELVRTNKGEYHLHEMNFSSLDVGDLLLTGSINGLPMRLLENGVIDNEERAKNQPGEAESTKMMYLYSDCDVDGADCIIPFNGEGNEFESSGEQYDPVVVDNLDVEYLEVTGTVANVSFSQLINDAIIRGEHAVIDGPKTIHGDLNLVELHVNSVINGQPSEEYIKELLQVNHTIVDGELQLDHSIIVQSIEVSGSISPNSTFLRQSIPKNNISFEAGLNVEFINNVNVSRLLNDSISIDKDIERESINFVGNISVENVNNTDLLNGVEFEKVVLLKESEFPQIVEGLWLIEGTLSVDGELKTLGLVNDMELSTLCRMNTTSPKVFVAGSVNAVTEPKVITSINNKDMDELKGLWFKDKPAILQGRASFSFVEAFVNASLSGFLNGLNISTLPNSYLSKTLTRVMQEPLYIAELVANGAEIRISKIEGKVNGLNIGEFSKKVLLRGVDQNFTGYPTFKEIVVPSLEGNFRFNGLNISTDVLRSDLERTVITGKKTINELEAYRVEVPTGVKIQEVDVNAWNEGAVFRENDTRINGNVTLSNATVTAALNVEGKVGSVYFDKSHILTLKGNHKISNTKTVNGTLITPILEVSGELNGINLDNFTIEIGYKDRDLIVDVPLAVDGIYGEHLELVGDVGGVNVTGLCQKIQNIIPIDFMDDDFGELFGSAEKIYHKLTNGAYFLDYYRVVQKLRSNATAISSVTVGSETLMVTFHNRSAQLQVEVMSWDSRLNGFKPAVVSLPEFSENLQYISSGLSLNHTYLFVERPGINSTLFLDTNTSYNAPIANVTCAVPIFLSEVDVCLFTGRNGSDDSLFCVDHWNNSLQLTQVFNSTKCVQAAPIKVGNEMWLAVISKRPIKEQLEEHLTMYSFKNNSFFFEPRQNLAVLNPVSVSTVFYAGFGYLAVASPHQPESVRSSIISIFRYYSKTDKWLRYQELPLEAPLVVEFAELPSNQLALYALSANPTRPMVVYLFKGIAGFVEETTGFAIRGGQRLSTFNIKGKHFVGISGHGYGQVMLAEMRGRRFG